VRDGLSELEPEIDHIGAVSNGDGHINDPIAAHLERIPST
jgi:hypothetical protein